MAFFKTISQSVYSPEFYSGIAKEKFGRALGYFALLGLLLAVFQSFGLIKPLFVSFPNATTEISAKLADYFPADLVIKVTDSKVSINKPEPYFLSIPFDLSKLGDGKNRDEGIEHLAVIDTKTPFSFEKFTAYKSVFWITSDSLVAFDNNNQARIVPLKDVKSATIDRAGFDLMMTKLAPFIKFISGFGGPILFVFAFIFMFLGNFVGGLFFLLFFTFAVWIAGRFFSFGYTYGQSYKIGMHAMTLGLIFKGLIWSSTFFTGHFVSTPPYLVSAITIAVVVANFGGMKKLPGHKEEEV
jgi:hypothetical protein